MILESCIIRRAGLIGTFPRTTSSLDVRKDYHVAIVQIKLAWTRYLCDHHELEEEGT